MTRSHQHREVFPVAPEALFALLHTPSDIRGWWGAARAVVIPAPGGVWAAAWGADEDRPDYVTTATMRVFDPPRRIVFGDYRYLAREGGLPFEADLVTEFVVEPHPEGSALTVVQHGFPADPAADAFYAACGQGWRDSFAGIRRHLAGGSA